MAADNKTIGRFELTGIPPAPRGVPQIEVTFDIDANGIVHVSAKDKGTGKEQSITITASSNLSEDQIQDAIKDAEKFAAEDNKRKELVETKNKADALVFSIEKFFRENGDNVDPADKEDLEKEMDKVKEALKTDDGDKIREATEELSKKSDAVFSKLYQQNGGDQQQPGGENA